MRDSGIWWLGAIPAGWDVIQSRRLFDQRKERMRSGDEQLTASQKYGVIPQKDFMRLEDQSVMQVFTGADILKHVEPGDFVISMRSFQGGLEWCGYAGCVSSAYVGLTPIKNVVPGFFKYLFKSRPYIRALQSTSNLVRDGQALRFQNFAQVSLPLVSDEEQTQIAKFLDYETAKMETLIEKQQQLITLLKEKRQAVISHAVTKGLNPDAPMRDSGVEWLGTVPRHWEVVPIKWVTTRVQTGTTPPTESERFYRDGSVPWYGPSSFGEPVGVGIPVKLIHESAIQEGKARQFRKGAILVVGIGATIGKSALAHTRCSANQQVTGLEFPDAILHPEYAALSLRRLEDVFRDRAQYTTMPIMNQQEIGAYHLAVPPLPEQLNIVNTLNARLSHMDVIVQQATDMASLLQERRTALISAAVTGKIDVRNWKRPGSASDGQTRAENE